MLAVLLLRAAPMAAYPLVDEACKDDPQACIEAGKLDYVSIYGGISDEDLEFFSMLDEALPPDAPFPRVFLNSHGGKVHAGIGIGRILRKHQAVAESGSPVIPDSTPQCTSACVLIAQGATHRRLTHVGLHGPSVRIKQVENVWQTQAVPLGDVKEYLEEMGAAPDLIRIMQDTPFSETADFLFDPKLPIEDQQIYKLGVYSTDKQMFSPMPDAIVGGFDFKSTEDYMVNAANYGSVQAIRDLAAFKTRHNPNVKPDFEAANRWLAMAAAKGDARSMHNLGYHYSYGLGFEQDHAKGVEFYLKAAKLGFAGSQNNLGWAYYTGVGVPKSLPDAIYWISKAAEQGEPFAYGSLCQIHEATDQFKSASAEGFMWCGLAVEHLLEGDAKDEAQVVHDRMAKTISPDDLAAGKLAIENWNTENITFSTMRNVGDDLNYVN